MIVGTGIDVIEVDRIRQSIERHGDRFVERIYSPEEAEYCRRMAAWPKHFAGRFAAKEAVAKALGTGIAGGVRCRDITIANDGHGRPRVELHGRALELSQKLGITSWHVSISHCDLCAVASAIAEG